MKSAWLQTVSNIILWREWRFNSVGSERIIGLLYHANDGDCKAEIMEHQEIVSLLRSSAIPPQFQIIEESHVPRLPCPPQTLPESGSRIARIISSRCQNSGSLIFERRVGRSLCSGFSLSARTSGRRAYRCHGREALWKDSMASKLVPHLVRQAVM